MFDTDRYAWVRPKSPPPQVQSAPLKKIPNPKNVFRSEPPKNGNPQILPEPSKHIRIIRRFRYGSILVHTDAYGSQIEPIRHILNFRDFPIFSVGDSQISCDRTHSSQVLPGGSKRIRIIRRFRYGSILVHSDAYGSQIEPVRHILIFRDFSQMFPILSDQVPDGPQAKSFRGGQGIHIFIDRYKRDMAICQARCFARHLALLQKRLVSAPDRNWLCSRKTWRCSRIKRGFAPEKRKQLGFAPERL